MPRNESLFVMKPFIAICAIAMVHSAAFAEDWPSWRGKKRLGIWNETGILEKFDKGGLEFTWRVPIKLGYGGPAVSNGRVFVTDFWYEDGNNGVERLICLQEDSGKKLWTREWSVNTRKLNRAWSNGPRCTPAVDGDRVYAMGSVGDLFCFNMESGETIWKKDFVEDYDLDLPIWGMTGHPLVDGEKLICLVGGRPDAKVVAFNKLTGDEVWRALDAEPGPGYAPPVIIHFGGVPQLIMWHPTGIASLNPETGHLFWEYEHPRIYVGQSIATPVLGGDKLLVSSFEPGTTVLQLDPLKPAAKLLWKSEGKHRTSEMGLQAFMSSPFIEGNYVYGNGGLGWLVCVDIRDGKIMWRTRAATEDARQALAFLVRNGNRFFINNDRGELIIAKLSPRGYEEVSRAELIEPTNRSTMNIRRERGAVNWTHPAYANGHIIQRNDKEIVRASLLETSAHALAP